MARLVCGLRNLCQTVRHCVGRLPTNHPPHHKLPARRPTQDRTCRDLHSGGSGDGHAIAGRWSLRDVVTTIVGTRQCVPASRGTCHFGHCRGPSIVHLNHREGHQHTHINCRRCTQKNMTESLELSVLQNDAVVPTRDVVNTS